MSAAILNIFSLIGLTLLTVGCASWGEALWTRQVGIDYKTVEGVKVSGDLYKPKAKGPHPAVVVVHGGGWKNRTGSMEPLCRKLVEAGFVVFRIDYRLAPQVHFPAPVDDVKAAIFWLRNNAAEYDIDPEKISGWGYSAGAHLILLAGEDPKTKLRSIVAGGTPADLTVWPKSPLVLALIGASREEQPQLWKDASPIYHVSETTPPLFMYHGKWDWIVEFEQMNRMAEAMRAKGRPVETHEVSFMGHFATFLLSQKSVELGIDFLKRN